MSCIFCKRDGKASNEDVVPKWLQSSMGWTHHDIEPTLQQVYDAAVIAKRKHKIKNLLAGRVCAACNNQWLSKLENRSKPILEPLLKRAADLRSRSRSQEDVLALWLAKTAAALDSTLFQPRIPQEHRDQIIAGELPHRVVVFVRQADDYASFFFVQNATWSTSPALSPAEMAFTNVGSYKVFLQLGPISAVVAYFPFTNWTFRAVTGFHSIVGRRPALPVDWYQPTKPIAPSDWQVYFLVFSGLIAVRQLWSAA